MKSELNHKAVCIENKSQERILRRICKKNGIYIAYNGKYGKSGKAQYPDTPYYAAIIDSDLGILCVVPVEEEERVRSAEYTPIIVKQFVKYLEDE